MKTSGDNIALLNLARSLQTDVKEIQGVDVLERLHEIAVSYVARRSAQSQAAAMAEANTQKVKELQATKRVAATMRPNYTELVNYIKYAEKSNDINEVLNALAHVNAAKASASLFYSGCYSPLACGLVSKLQDMRDPKPWMLSGEALEEFVRNTKVDANFAAPYCRLTITRV